MSGKRKQICCSQPRSILPLGATFVTLGTGVIPKPLLTGAPPPKKLRTVNILPKASHYPNGTTNYFVVPQPLFLNVEKKSVCHTQSWHSDRPSLSRTYLEATLDVGSRRHITSPKSVIQPVVPNLNPEISNPLDNKLLDDLHLQMNFLGKLIRTQAHTEKTACFVLTQMTKLIELFISTYLKRCSMKDIIIFDESHSREMQLSLVLEALKGEAYIQNKIPEPKIPGAKSSKKTKTVYAESPNKSKPKKERCIPIEVVQEPDIVECVPPSIGVKIEKEDDSIQDNSNIHGGLCLTVEYSPLGQEQDCKPSTQAISHDSNIQGPASTRGGDESVLGTAKTPGPVLQITKEESLLSAPSPDTDHKVIITPVHKQPAQVANPPEPVLQVTQVGSLCNVTSPDTNSSTIMNQPTAKLGRYDLPMVKAVSTLPIASSLKFKQYRCFICEYSTKVPFAYFDANLLYAHVWHNHLLQNTGTDNSMKCPMCDTKVTLRVHKVKNPIVAGEYLFRMVMRHLISKHCCQVPDYVESEKCKEPACDYSALTQADMRAHEQLHSKGAYFCIICYQGFGREVTCFQHQFQQHNLNPKSETIFNCSLCDFRCLRPHVLRNHNRYKHPQLLVKRKKKNNTESQPTCRKKGTKAWAKPRRTAVCIRPIGKKNQPDILSYVEHICFLCEFTKKEQIKFLIEEDLYKHVSEAHTTGGENSTDMACPKCGKKKPLDTPTAFAKRRKVAYHNVLVHLIVKHKWLIPDYINTVKCAVSECTFCAVSKAHLRIHEHCHREKSLCKMCGKTFHYSALRKHEDSCPANPDRKEPKNKKVECSVCGLHVWHLDVHMKAHDRTKKPCHICSKPLSKAGLEIHMFHAHGLNVANKPEIKCADCDYVTLMPPSRLQCHRKHNHEPAKRRKCHKCHITVTEGHMNEHMKLVHGPRSFSCKQCPYLATNRVALNMHLAAQHMGVRYKCDWCPYTSGYKCNVTKHRHTCRNNPKNKNKT